ncbi:MAG: hypothetical protein K6A23_04355 [Butyrivibrio sp.]|nr:hypothetical protein [Butyrivibrio sp.]
MRRTRKLFNNNTVNMIAFTIPIVAMVMAIVIFAFILNALRSEPVTTGLKEVKETAKGEALNKDIDEPVSYISETNYKGALSQFPELYQIPFKKTESYVSNKEFSKEHSDIFTECEEDATEFFETLFNVNYRDILNDSKGFVTDVMKNGDYDAYVTKFYDTDDQETIYFYRYINELAEYFIENQVQMEAKFYTDDSLVYSDYYTFVRGELVFTIYSSEDGSSEYETGKEYQVPVEAAMHRCPSDQSDRVICSFGLAEDQTFFFNP